MQRRKKMVAVVLVCIAILLISSVLTLTGCGSIPIYISKNEPAELDWPSESPDRYEHYDKSYGVDRTRIQHWHSSDSQTKAPRFIGVAISGGGSRAANFGIAVLQELETLGILDHTAAISSVSGGSLVAAYYGLFRNSSDWSWDAARKAMAINFYRSWLWKMLSPHNVLRQFFTGYDRSNVLANVFDDQLFHGATFGRLGTQGPRIYINATDLILGTGYQMSFTFANDTFSTLESRLDTFPIADAVSASGAFPLIFSNVTLRDYRPRSIRFVEDDILDSSTLIAKLLDKDDPVSLHLQSLVPAAKLDNLRMCRGAGGEKKCLTSVLNHLVDYVTYRPDPEKKRCIMSECSHLSRFRERQRLYF